LAACVASHRAFQGQLFHHRRTSTSGYGPTTHRPPVRPVGLRVVSPSSIPPTRFVAHPPTTMAAPTLPRFHRRVIASVSGESLTFMPVDYMVATVAVTLVDPSRSLRNPEHRQGRSGVLSHVVAGIPLGRLRDQNRFIHAMLVCSSSPTCVVTATQGRRLPSARLIRGGGSNFP
jgi:hypothetical protein